MATVAHRGASISAPENTLSSVAQGVADQADFVEFDVQLTKDGVPVVFHDRSLARTTDVESVFPGRSPWLVRDFTLSEVQRLDAGSWKSRSYANERVPTLAAILGQLSQSPSGAYLEVKTPAAYGGVDGIGAKVYDTVMARWPDALTGTGPRRLLVLSFDESFVRGFAERYPDVPVSVIAQSATPGVVGAFADDTDVFHANLTPDAAADVHAAGLTVGAWTVDDTATMAQLADYVDSITTNRPALLRSVLVTRGKLYTGTPWPGKVSATPSWSLGTSGSRLNRPVTVRATLTGPGGEPARWQWAEVQRWADGTWRTVLRRATDSAGRFSATIPGTAGLRIRVLSREGGQYPVSRSPAVDVPLSKLGSSVRLSGPVSVRRGHRAALTVRWSASDGRPLSGKARLYKRRAGGAWWHVRDLRVANGYLRTRVYPGRTTSFQVRTRTGWWYLPDVDSERVRVVR